MAWVAPYAAPFLDTEHYFSIAPLGDRGSRLEHGLLAYGLGTALAARTIDRVTRVRFDQMNHALKQRTEQMNGGRHG